MINWFLGTIGFSYKDWVGSFYPVGTAPRGYLSYYSKVFHSVELDTTPVKSKDNVTVEGSLVQMIMLPKCPPP